MASGAAAICDGAAAWLVAFEESRREQAAIVDAPTRNIGNWSLRAPAT